VSSATSFGIFVTLDAMYVEGLVHITELGGEYFKFDEARQELRGERTGIRYSIGTRVRVQVSRVDLDGRKIDFRLVHEGGELPVPRPSRDRSGGGGRGQRQSGGADEGAARAPRGSAAPAPLAEAERPARGKPAAKNSGKKSAPKASGKSRKSRR